VLIKLQQGTIKMNPENNKELNKAGEREDEHLSIAEQMLLQSICLDVEEKRKNTKLDD